MRSSMLRRKDLNHARMNNLDPIPIQSSMMEILVKQKFRFPSAHIEL